MAWGGTSREFLSLFEWTNQNPAIRGDPRIFEPWFRYPGNEWGQIDGESQQRDGGLHPKPKVKYTIMVWMKSRWIFERRVAGGWCFMENGEWFGHAQWGYYLFLEPRKMYTESAKFYQFRLGRIQILHRYSPRLSSCSQPQQHDLPGRLSYCLSFLGWHPKNSCQFRRPIYFTSPIRKSEWVGDFGVRSSSLLSCSPFPSQISAI